MGIGFAYASPAADQIQNIKSFLEKKVVEQYALTPSDSYTVTIHNPAEITSLLKQWNLNDPDYVLPDSFSLLGKKILSLRVGPEAKLVLPVLAEIKANAQVLVFKTKLGRHVRIQEKDLALEPRDLTFIPKGYLRRATEVLDKETAVYIRPQQPIYPYMIREVPMIRAKQKIKLRWADPLVAVQVDGLALQDGYLDQEISVMNLASSKKLKGRVLSEGVVEIR